MQSKFIYNSEFELRIEKSISSERLDLYRGIVPSASVFSRVIEIYTANMSLGEALLGPIQIMEITLRNSISNQLSSIYGTDWITDNRIDLDPRSLKTLQGVYKKYKDKPIYNTPDLLASKVVSELTLGFWQQLFVKQYEQPLWRKCLRNAFPHSGGPLTRQKVHSAVDEVRRLRNRIVHHEQIIKYPLDDLYNKIITIVAWIDPIVAIWLSHNNRFHDIKSSFDTELFELVCRDETT